MIKGIYGINIAVKDLAEAVKKYEKVFGVKSEALGEGDFAFPGLVGAKMDVNGTFVNLISYTDENTSVAKFLSTKGEGVFLVSIEVDNVDSSVEELKERGLQFIFKESLKGNFGEVNFAHPKSANGVQFEIYRPNR